MKKRNLIVILALFVSVNSFAQKVRVNAVNNDFEKYRGSTFFDYAHQDFDSTKLIWVADLTIEFDTIISGMIGECFNQLKEKANKLGASGFRVTDSDLDSYGPTKYISISTYWIRMEDRSENLTLFKSNEVFMFGYLGYHSEIEGYKISVNDQEFVMRARSYRKFEFLDDQKINLILGSKSRGDTKTIHIHDGMKPKYFYFNMVKGQFKNAYIAEYDDNFANFLINILQNNSK